MKRVAGLTAFALSLCSPLAFAEMNSPQAARHVLSLNDVEITALIDDVSIITGYTFILHPDVRRTKVTVMSQSPMSTDDVFQVFLSTLRVHGFAAVPSGKGVYRILPEQTAIGEAGFAATRLGKPFDVNVAPEEAGNVGKCHRGAAPRGHEFRRVCAGETRGDLARALDACGLALPCDPRAGAPPIE